MNYEQKYNDIVGKYDLLAKQYEHLKTQYITLVNSESRKDKYYKLCVKKLKLEIKELRNKHLTKETI